MINAVYGSGTRRAMNKMPGCGPQKVSNASTANHRVFGRTSFLTWFLTPRRQIHGLHTKLSYERITILIYSCTMWMPTSSSTVNVHRDTHSNRTPDPVKKTRLYGMQRALRLAPNSSQLRSKLFMCSLASTKGEKEEEKNHAHQLECPLTDADIQPT